MDFPMFKNDFRKSSGIPGKMKTFCKRMTTVGDKLRKRTFNHLDFAVPLIDFVTFVLCQKIPITIQ